MRNWYPMAFALLTIMTASCYRGAEPSPTVDSAEPSTESEAEIVGESSLAAACGYKSPPRCGPRNCVAMCVTCLYDICRASGGSCTDCKREMEACKDECGETECPPSNPFCDIKAR
jgi:hypothetical protein